MQIWPSAENIMYTVSCELSFIWSKMRNLAQETAFQIALRNCSKEVKWKWKMAQLCLTLCDPMGYAVHGILQARILQWVAFPFSRGSSQPWDQTQVSRIAGGFFISWAVREAQEYWIG